MSVRVLVTGFSAFPRAPVNPSEVLIGHLARMTPISGVELEASVLPVEYDRIPALLSALGSEFRPDIAIHFGLADTARGFRVERTARNRCSILSPDAAGFVPKEERFARGSRTLPSTLPVDMLEAALAARGLPVQRSANAGAYLCNYTFYLSRSGLAAGFAPTMSGFVHIPFLDSQLAVLDPERAARLFAIGEEDLVEGARIIIAACAAAIRSPLPQLAVG